MSNNLKMIIDFVNQIDYPQEEKDFIIKHLPEHISKMETAFIKKEGEEISYESIQHVLSYTMLNAVVKMKEFYSQGRLDAYTEIVKHE